MHELGIVFHIIDTVEQVGRENGVTQVRSVTLDVGQVSGIEDPYFDGLLALGGGSIGDAARRPVAD